MNQNIYRVSLPAGSVVEFAGPADYPSRRNAAPAIDPQGAHHVHIYVDGAYYTQVRVFSSQLPSTIKSLAVKEFSRAFPGRHVVAL